MNELTK